MINYIRAMLAGPRLLRALTPSTHTKAMHIGEYTFAQTTHVGDDGNDVVVTVTVPWTTVKEIMSTIRLDAGVRS